MTALLNGTVKARMTGGGPANKLVGEVTAPPPQLLRFGSRGGFVYRLDDGAGSGKGAVYRYDRGATRQALLHLGFDPFDVALVTGDRDAAAVFTGPQAKKLAPVQDIRVDVQVYTDTYAMMIDNLVVARAARADYPTPDDVQGWVEETVDRLRDQQADNDALALAAREMEQG